MTFPIDRRAPRADEPPCSTSSIGAVKPRSFVALRERGARATRRAARCSSSRRALAFERWFGVTPDRSRHVASRARRVWP